MTRKDLGQIDIVTDAGCGFLPLFRTVCPNKKGGAEAPPERIRNSYRCIRFLLPSSIAPANSIRVAPPRR